MHWTEEIAAVTQSEEFQTAEIVLTNPQDRGDYDIDTGTWSGGPDTPLYSGRARVIGVRWGVNNQNVQQVNPTTISAIRVQIPPGAYDGIINRGWVVRVTNGFRTPSWVGKTFKVTSDVQGASSATRTFECALDVDSRT